MQAEEVYKRVLEKEPGNSLAFRDLISLYEEVGDLYSKMGDVEKTEETLLKALDVLDEKLRKHPGYISNIRKHSEILQALGKSFSIKEILKKQVNMLKSP